MPFNLCLLKEADVKLKRAMERKLSLMRLGNVVSEQRTIMANEGFCQCAGGCVPFCQRSGMEMMNMASTTARTESRNKHQ